MHFTLVLSLSFDEVELRIGAHILVKYTYTRRTIAITIEAHYNILFPCSLPWKKYFRLVNLYRGNVGGVDNEYFNGHRRNLHKSLLINRPKKV